MDREISKKNRFRANVLKWLKYLLIFIVFISLYFLARNLLKIKASSTEFHIAKVEKGNIQNMLTASGVVVPSFEREINAPVNTEIKKVILSKGSEVKKGQLILELDQEFTRLEYEKLYDELELKRNNIFKLKLKYDKDLMDLDYQNQIKSLQLSELKTQVIDQKRLLDIGGSTQEDLEQAELNLKVAELEKKMLENNLAFARNVNVKEKENLELEYKIQEKRLKELARKLEETSVKAPLDGVITWINEDIGRTVIAGEPLVRIAVLDSYLVEANASDRNSEKIEVGMPVTVRINRQDLKANISTVLPEVENNSVKFLVEFENKNEGILRPNMRAEVFIITGEKNNILRVKNGAGFKGAKNQDVFVIRGDEAIRTKIIKGLSNSDFVEISGDEIQLGDEIIISDMKDYEHLDRFIIKKSN